MLYKELCCYITILMVLNVQCEICSLQQSNTTWEVYTHCKVNFFANKSYVDCMEHCKKLGSRAIPVRTLQEWEEMEEMVEELRAHYNPSDFILYLSVTKGEVKKGDAYGMDSLTLEHWPTEIREAKQDVWRDYYTGELVENNKTAIIMESAEGNASCAALWCLPHSPCGWYSSFCALKTPSATYTRYCPCQQQTQLLLRGTCSSSNLRGPHGAAVYFSPRHTPGSFDKTFFESRKGFFVGLYVPPSLSRIEYNA